MSQQEKVRIGQIGLGHLGWPIALRFLRTGYALAAFDLSSEVLEKAAAEGATVCGSPREVAQVTDVVFTVLPLSAVVAHVIEGLDGLSEGLSKGSIVVDMSSGDPPETLKIAGRLREQGVSYVDVGVSRGVVAAERGELVAFVGGDSKSLDRVQPLLQCIASDIVHVGPVGAGHTAKALNNLMGAASFALSCEVLIAAERLGLDQDAFLAAVNHGSGGSFATQVKLPMYVRSGSFDSKFAINLMAKDTRQGLALLRAVGLGSELAQAVRSLWEEATEDLSPEEDHTRLYQRMKSEGFA